MVGLGSPMAALISVAERALPAAARTSRMRSMRMLFGIFSPMVAAAIDEPGEESACFVLLSFIERPDWLIDSRFRPALLRQIVSFIDSKPSVSCKTEKARGDSHRQRRQPCFRGIVFASAFGEDAGHFRGAAVSAPVSRPGFCLSRSDLPMRARVMPMNNDAAHAALALRRDARGRKQ